MNVKKNNQILLTLVFFALSVSLISCEEEELLTSNRPFLIVDAEGNTSIEDTQLEVWLAFIPKQPLDVSEINSLNFIREEEKLAHDVYTVFYQKYGNRIFYNISSSETTHYAAIGRLLERYNLPDPSAGKALGEFENEVLQQLFDDLVARGSFSLTEALKVGALIEEVDIRDIQNDLDQNINNDDIEMVYSNLMKGSRNHLRAFVRQLEFQGLNYEPEILAIDQYNEIVNSQIEQGRAN